MHSARIRIVGIKLQCTLYLTFSSRPVPVVGGSNPTKSDVCLARGRVQLQRLFGGGFSLRHCLFRTHAVIAAQRNQ